MVSGFPIPLTRRNLGPAFCNSLLKFATSQFQKADSVTIALSTFMNTTVLLLRIIIAVIISIIICPILLSPIAPIAMIDQRRRAAKMREKKTKKWIQQTNRTSQFRHRCFLSCVFYSRIFDQPISRGRKLVITGL